MARRRGFFIRGGTPGEFPPAPAQTMVEYGGLASKNQGGGKLGRALNHKFGSVMNRGSSAKQSKARGLRIRKSKPRAGSSRWKSARKM